MSSMCWEGFVMILSFFRKECLVMQWHRMRASMGCEIKAKDGIYVCFIGVGTCSFVHVFVHTYLYI